MRNMSDNRLKFNPGDDEADESTSEDAKIATKKSTKDLPEKFQVTFSVPPRHLGSGSTAYIDIDSFARTSNVPDFKEWLELSVPATILTDEAGMQAVYENLQKVFRHILHICSVITREDNIRVLSLRLVYESVKIIFPDSGPNSIFRMAATEGIRLLSLYSTFLNFPSDKLTQRAEEAKDVVEPSFIPVEKKYGPSKVPTSDIQQRDIEDFPLGSVPERKFATADQEIALLEKQIQAIENMRNWLDAVIAREIEIDGYTAETLSEILLVIFSHIASQCLLSARQQNLEDKVERLIRSSTSGSATPAGNKLACMNAYLLTQQKYYHTAEVRSSPRTIHPPFNYREWLLSSIPDDLQIDESTLIELDEIFNRICNDIIRECVEEARRNRMSTLTHEHIEEVIKSLFCNAIARLATAEEDRLLFIYNCFQKLYENSDERKLKKEEIPIIAKDIIPEGSPYDVKPGNGIPTHTELDEVPWLPDMTRAMDQRVPNGKPTATYWDHPKSIQTPQEFYESELAVARGTRFDAMSQTTTTPVQPNQGYCKLTTTEKAVPSVIEDDLVSQCARMPIEPSKIMPIKPAHPTINDMQPSVFHVPNSASLEENLTHIYGISGCDSSAKSCNIKFNTRNIIMYNLPESKKRESVVKKPHRSWDVVGASTSAHCDERISKGKFLPSSQDRPFTLGESDQTTAPKNGKRFNKYDTVDGHERDGLSAARSIAENLTHIYGIDRDFPVTDPTPPSELLNKYRY